jgi:hypothetical protein
MTVAANSNLARRARQIIAGEFKTWDAFVADHAPTKQEEPNEAMRARKAVNRAKGTLSLFRTYYGAEAGYDKQAKKLFFRPGKATPDYVAVKAKKPAAPRKAKAAPAPETVSA